MYHKETRKKITFEEYKALSREQQQEYNVIPTYKYYSVFNLDQTNFSDVRPEEWEALREKFRGGQAEQPEIDAMLEAKSWFCPIREQQGDRAFYSPLADYIVVPLRSQFVDMQSFYETLLHEMGHSTGHPTRLNRDLAHPFGSEEYGKEELTAEFAAALAGMFFGIAEHIRTEKRSLSEKLDIRRLFAKPPVLWRMAAKPSFPKAGPAAYTWCGALKQSIPT